MYMQALTFLKDRVHAEVIYADFEKTIHLVVSKVWSNVQLKG